MNAILAEYDFYLEQLRGIPLHNSLYLVFTISSLDAVPYWNVNVNNTRKKLILDFARCSFFFHSICYIRFELDLGPYNFLRMLRLSHRERIITWMTTRIINPWLRWYKWGVSIGNLIMKQIVIKSIICTYRNLFEAKVKWIDLCIPAPRNSTIEYIPYPPHGI
jgi:hypothetical protein